MQQQHTPKRKRKANPHRLTPRKSKPTEFSPRRSPRLARKRNQTRGEKIKRKLNYDSEGAQTSSTSTAGQSSKKRKQEASDEEVELSLRSPKKIQKKNVQSHPSSSSDYTGKDSNVEDGASVSSNTESTPPPPNKQSTIPPSNKQAKSEPHSDSDVAKTEKDASKPPRAASWSVVTCRLSPLICLGGHFETELDLQSWA